MARQLNLATHSLLRENTTDRKPFRRRIYNPHVAQVRMT